MAEIRIKCQLARPWGWVEQESPDVAAYCELSVDKAGGPE